MYVVRVNLDGAFMESRPCSHCLYYMRNVGVKRVVFSTADGALQNVAMSELTNDHVCSSRR